MIGVAPETISVWKRHPQWQLEVDRWRELAALPLDRLQQRLQLEAAEATIEAFQQLRLIMGSASKRVRTSSGLSEQPDWPTRPKASRLLVAMAAATVAEFGAQPDRRTLPSAPERHPQRNHRSPSTT
jgi:hypothetical protein